MPGSRRLLLRRRHCVALPITLTYVTAASVYTLSPLPNVQYRRPTVLSPTRPLSVPIPLSMASLGVCGPFNRGGRRAIKIDIGQSGVSRCPLSSKLTRNENVLSPGLGPEVFECVVVRYTCGLGLMSLMIFIEPVLITSASS